MLKLKILIFDIRIKWNYNECGKKILVNHKKLFKGHINSYRNNV